MNKKSEFMKELADLLDKHNASIEVGADVEGYVSSFDINFPGCDYIELAGIYSTGIELTADVARLYVEDDENE